MFYFAILLGLSVPSPAPSGLPDLMTTVPNTSGGNMQQQQQMAEGRQVDTQVRVHADFTKQNS